MSDTDNVETVHILVMLDSAAKIKAFADISGSSQARVRVKHIDGSLFPGDSIMSLFMLDLSHPIQVSATGNSSQTGRLLDRLGDTGISYREDTTGNTCEDVRWKKMLNAYGLRRKTAKV